MKNPKKRRYTDRLEIRHNPELVDLFAVELPDECLGRMVDVLARGEKPGQPREYLRLLLTHP